MTAAFRDSDSQGNSTSGTGGLNVPLRIVAGDVVFVKTIQGGNAARTLSDGVNTFVAMTPTVIRTDGATDENQIYVCNTPVAGNTTLSLTLNTPQGFRGIQWMTVQGGNAAAVQFTGKFMTSGSTANDVVSSGNVSIVTANGALFGWAYDFDTFNTGLAHGTGFNFVTNFQTETNVNGGSSLLENKRLTATGNTSANMTAATSGETVIIFAVYVPDASTAVTQTLTPNADTITGNWVPNIGTTLFGVISESIENDADYAALSGIVGSTFRVALSSANDPLQSTNHVVSYAITSTNGNMNVRLVQDANTTIAQWAHVPVAGNFTAFNQTLSNAQADAITNYGNLFLEFIAY